ncbi:MAG: PIG-L family deacetylase [Paludibacter sp.]|nr:PIG-L family deacetylase [Paludibacter sp.]
MNSNYPKSIAVIVAHPDDETLWAGGTILEHPSNKWYIISLCRAGDSDRAERFYNTLNILNAEGNMGDLDDGPDQLPLDKKELENEILRLLPHNHYDLIITHHHTGEYTRHLRHEEVSKAVLNLWHEKKIKTLELWTFAYEDGNKAYLPKAIENANFTEKLSGNIWARKYSIITDIYGFEKNSWEAKSTPKTEAFWQFRDSKTAINSIRP